MRDPDVRRFQLIVHYDGSAFHGWQVQPELRTVQGELQDALSRLADRPRTVIGSGRTDTGVHATGQVASVDMPSRWTPAKLHVALNAVLPDDVWVERVRPVHPAFHARYDALARSYTYRVGLRAEAASPFHRRWCWALGEVPLDGALLHAAAQAVIGAHSFRAFAKAGQPERGERCDVRVAEWSEWELGAKFRITADRYLHHMVRYLVGTMIDVARGRRPLEDVAALLEGSDPELTTSPPAPPEGLFLSRVDYPASVLQEPPSPARGMAAHTKTIPGDADV